MGSHLESQTFLVLEAVLVTGGLFALSLIVRIVAALL
jgi:hypothetical protein